jgi:hypothetical protein
MGLDIGKRGEFVLRIFVLKKGVKGREVDKNEMRELTAGGKRGFIDNRGMYCG